MELNPEKSHLIHLSLGDRAYHDLAIARLFSFFMNDPPPPLKCDSLLLADDLKIFKLIKSYEGSSIVLQDNLNTLNTWCNTNELKLNENECVVILFTGRSDMHTNFQVMNSSRE